MLFVAYALGALSTHAVLEGTEKTTVPTTKTPGKPNSKTTKATEPEATEPEATESPVQRTTFEGIYLPDYI